MTEETAAAAAGPRHVVLRHGGRDLPAVAFPIPQPRNARAWRAIMAILFFGLATFAATMFVLSFDVPYGWMWVLRAALALGALACFSFGVLTVLAWSGPFFVALHEAGIDSRMGSTRTFVPWDTITKTGSHTFAGCEYVGIRTSRPAETAPKWLRAFRMLNRGAAGWHHTFPIFAMPGGRAFAYYVQRCVADPSARPHVGRETTA